MSVRKKQERKKRKISERALDCLIENGIENTAISMIAKRAEIPERTVYRYFETKEKIIASAYKLFWDYIYIGIELTLTKKYPDKMNGIAQTERSMKKYANLVLKNPEIFVLLQEMEAYLHNSGIHLDRASAFADEYEIVEPLYQSFLLGIEDQSIRQDLDIDITFEMIYSSLFGLMKQIALNLVENASKLEAMEQQLNAFIDMTILYIRKKEE